VSTIEHFFCGLVAASLWRFEDHLKTAIGERLRSLYWRWRRLSPRTWAHTCIASPKECIEVVPNNLNYGKQIGLFVPSLYFQYIPTMFITIFHILLVLGTMVVVWCLDRSLLYSLAYSPRFTHNTMWLLLVFYRSSPFLSHRLQFLMKLVVFVDRINCAFFFTMVSGN
jgi:hypothetical protein